MGEGQYVSVWIQKDRLLQLWK